MSLRLRFLLGLVPLFIAGLVVADVATYTSLQSFLLSRVDSQLLSVHPTVEAALLGDGRGPDGGGGGGPGAGGPSAVPAGTFGEIRTASGSVMASSIFALQGSDASSRPTLPANLTPGTESAPALLTVSGTGSVSRYRVYVDSVKDRSGDILVVALPLSDVESTLTQLLILELGISGGVTLVVVVATWFIVRRGLRPLERMGNTARSIAASDLSRRVTPATERSEVGRLGLALNTMLSQLETAFAARAASEARLRHFLSDASHELRTPLTSIRGYAELLRLEPHLSDSERATSVRRIEDEASRMGVLVDDLLLLARLDQGRALERSPVDLAELVEDACADARAADPGRPITVITTDPPLINGDEARLRQVLGNLLRNALVHTPAGTPVEVRVGTRARHAVLEVVDHGPGIPHGAADRVFERFHRADPDRSRDQGGSGLGLSIVAAVVAAHAGRIQASGTPGGGATFRIELPLDEPPQPSRPPQEMSLSQL